MVAPKFERLINLRQALSDILLRKVDEEMTEDEIREQFELALKRWEREK